MPSLFVRVNLAVVAGLLALAVDATAQTATYAVDFVSTAASGSAMNGQGMATGVRFRLPPGCTPSTCLGVREAVVWSGSTATVLPLLPDFSTVTPVGINSSGWVAGYAGDPTTTGGRAVVWKPTPDGYAAIDLGVLPGTSRSWAAGIDDQGRAIGWSTTGNIPTATAPFVWTEATGLVDLSAQGFPNEVPLAVSPGGTVATPGYWYRVGDPSSVTPLAPPPSGFSGPGTFPAAVNDAGDQARFQISTIPPFRPFLFRYQGASGTWQQIWGPPVLFIAPYGIGGINSQADITATMNGAGLIAPGPAGPGQPLSPRLSAAYTGSNDPFTIAVPTGGPINDAGQILARAIIGRSPRLVRLAAAEACAGGCVRVASIEMTGRMVGDPPGQCTPEAYNEVAAVVRLASENGAPVRRATVKARLLDDYYLDQPLVGTTGFGGAVRFAHVGPACVGATAVLVEAVAPVRNRRLDRTMGELVDFVIPEP